MNPSTAFPASCGSCGVHACELNAEAALCRIPLEKQAWLLDEMWPEFDAYLGLRRNADPLVLLPWKSRAWPIHGYHWPSLSGMAIKSAPMTTLRRSLAMRFTSATGGMRQSILERFDRIQASAYARKIPYHALDLVVWQNFLPFLHLDKVLGGRQYDVLMWRAPRHLLEATLDRALAEYPESTTLRDFRSSPELARAERIALERARRIVTPHRDLARLFPEKTTVLDWVLSPKLDRVVTGSKLAFLGPTLGRRGAYIMRMAARMLGVPVIVLGRNLEHPDFWQGVEIEERPISEHSLNEVGLLVSPAITDFKPRFLLRALGLGIPVIATEACGLPEMPGLHFCDAFNATGLAEKIETLNQRAKPSDKT